MDIDEMYKQHFGPVCVYVFRIIHARGTWQDAQDITQDAFVKAHLKFDPEKGMSFRNFFYMVANGLAINFLNRLCNRTVHVSISPTSGEDNAPGAIDVDVLSGSQFDSGINEDAGEEILREEEVKEFKEAFDQLDEQHKIILKRTWCGFKQEDIAEELEMPRQNLPYHKRTAIKKLREHLRPYFSDGVERKGAFYV